MAAKSGAVWSIDVGTNSMKALRLQVVDGRVEVIDFDNIEYSRILTSQEAVEQRSALVAETLREFVSRHELGGDEIVISIPGQNSFARFIKLPPVESKRIPEIIRFEAIQQIPFDINEVEWDWQLMQKPDSPEVEVGIFAIKNDLLNTALEPFNKENIRVSCVQMSPMALYNYILYDRKELGDASANSNEPGDRKAVIVLDMGTENTDLVICTQKGVWQRCIPLGGNAFTRAVAETFKLDFEKAEKLKRTAPMSKYARQIFQAMKPVFTDFGAEVQRSVGFYKSGRRQTAFTRMIILGGGMKLQGIGKFLQQSLQIPVVKPDSFEKITVSSAVSAAKFHENVSDFGVVYGLALQGLGLGRIESNLLPRKVARSMLWARKAKYITVAAAVLLVVCLACLARSIYDKGKYQSNERVRREIAGVIDAAESASQKLKDEKALDSKYKTAIDKQLDLFKYRSVIPLLYQTVISCLPNAENNPEQAKLYDAFSVGDIGAIKQVERRERKQVFVTSLSVGYTENVMEARFGDFAGRRAGGGGAVAAPGMPGAGAAARGGGGGGGFRAVPGAPSGRGASRGGPQRSSRRSRRRRTAGEEEEDSSVTEKATAGFVVTVEGYSPYKNIAELLDPVGATSDRSRWGVVTRLMNLDKTFVCEDCGKMLIGREQAPTVCPECGGERLKALPFELCERTNIQHFILQTGEVELGNSEMPAGIGLSLDEGAAMGRAGQGNVAMPAGLTARGRPMSATRDSQGLLIDPMTREVISKVVERDENGNEKYDVFGNPLYVVNDHWFRIQAKFTWKGLSQPKAKAKEQDEGDKSSRRRRSSRKRK